jgi:hypothetical protein
MKYQIRPIDEETGFVPFDITFRIETKEEHTILHDLIATKIAESSQFIGDVFMAGRKAIVSSGNVPLKVSR